MKCQVCGEQEATIHYIEIIDGQKADQWICVPCAEKEGITPTEVTQLAHGSLESFLGGMLTSTPEDRTEEKSEEAMTCNVCGYTYKQLQEKGLLGCSTCYSSFRRQLIPMLRRYHGAVNHLGKLPRSHGPQAALRREIISMKQLLEQAVAQESYEEAARIRDEIREKERQLETIQIDSDPDHEDTAEGSDSNSEQ